MIKTLLIGGLAATIAAGAAVAQTGQPPAPPLGGGPQAQQGPGGPGPGAGPGARRGPGMRGFGRFGARQRPTVADLQQRNAQMFAQLDLNKDGRATQAEFQGFLERRRQERQQQMFQRFSGGQDSVTLDQLNARTAERFNERPGGPGGGGRGR